MPGHLHHLQQRFGVRGRLLLETGSQEETMLPGRALSSPEQRWKILTSSSSKGLQLSLSTAEQNPRNQQRDAPGGRAACARFIQGPAAWHPNKVWSQVTACTSLQAHGKLPSGHEGSESSNQSEGSIIRDSLGFKSANAIKLSSQVCGNSTRNPAASQCLDMCRMLPNSRMLRHGRNLT